MDTCHALYTLVWVVNDVEFLCGQGWVCVGVVGRYAPKPTLDWCEGCPFTNFEPKMNTIGQKMWTKTPKMGSF